VVPANDELVTYTARAVDITGVSTFGGPPGAVWVVRANSVL
jgi:hypothetical protein